MVLDRIYRNIFSTRLYLTKGTNVVSYILFLFLFLNLSACTLENFKVDLTQKFIGFVDVKITAPEKINANSGSSVNVSVEFGSEFPEIVDESDLQISGAEIVTGSFTGKNKKYTFNLNPLFEPGKKTGIIEILFPSKNVTVSGKKIKTNSGKVLILVDIEAPVPTLATETISPTALSAIPIKLAFNEGVTGLTLDDFIITESNVGAGGGGASLVISPSCAVDSDVHGCSEYNLTLHPVSTAEIEIQLKANSAIDSMGNANTDSNILKVVYDVSIPTPTLSTTTPSISNTNSIPVTLDFNGIDVTGLGVASFEIVNGTISSLTGSGSSYVLNIDPTQDGLVTVQVKAGSVKNIYDTPNVASNLLSVTIDTESPTFLFTSPTLSKGKSSTEFTWKITYSDFSEINLDSSKITLNSTNGVSCSNPTLSLGAETNSRLITVKNCLGNGTVNLVVAAATATDIAGNNAASGTSEAVTIDNLPPSLTVLTPSAVRVSSKTTTVFEVKYSDDSEITLTNADVSLTAVTGVSCSSDLSIVGSSAYVTLSKCSGNGNITSLKIAANTAKDDVGNLAAAAVGTYTVYVDNKPPNLPTVTLNVPTTNPGGTPNPELSIKNLTPGDVPTIYLDSSCSSAVASGTAVSANLLLKTSSLTTGTYNFYVKSADSVGNETACANTGVSYVYIPCVANQKIAEGVCADPIIVTLGDSTQDPEVTMRHQNPGFAIDLESNTPGVVTQATQGPSSIVMLKINPTGAPGVTVSYWPNRLVLEELKFCNKGGSGTGSISALNSMGSYKIKSAGNLFSNCTQLTEISDMVKLNSALSGATVFRSMFENARIFNQSLVGLNTSNVTDMTSMFSGASNYNQPLPDSFDTSKVTSMSSMFAVATSYNQPFPINFNTAKVISMYRMFWAASNFNQVLPLSFNTSLVVNMEDMFLDASSYNQVLPTSFNTQNVTTMANMFSGASAYDKPLPESFNTSKVTSMLRMFNGARSFNQPFPNSFDTSNVTLMENMFHNALVFDQDLRSTLNVCKAPASTKIGDNSPISGTTKVPLFGDLSRCNKGGPK